MRGHVLLGPDDIVRLHEMVVARTGGAPGIRDSKALEAAAAMPHAVFGGKYLHRTVAAMAGAYLFHLCQAHAFVDGNKRVAVVAALVFLDLNGYGFDADEGALERLVMGLAAHEAGKDDVVRFFRKHTKRLDT